MQHVQVFTENPGLISTVENIKTTSLYNIIEFVLRITRKKLLYASITCLQITFIYLFFMTSVKQ